MNAPAAASFTPRKGYVDTPEGQLHYRSAGQGPALLLLHQAPLCGAEWDDVMAALAPHYRVIAPDMAGHGESFDPPHEFEMADYLRTTGALLDALGLDAFAVAGNHSGAALGIALALARPQQVRKLAVSCEMLLTPAQVEGFLQALASRPMTRDLPVTDDAAYLATAWERYRALAPTAPPQVRLRPFVIGQAARFRPFDAHYAMLRWMAQGGHLARVRCPTLIFGAEHDLFFNAQSLADAARTMPHCRSVTIPEAGAMCAFEQPQRLAAHLHAFFGA